MSDRAAEAVEAPAETAADGRPRSSVLAADVLRRAARLYAQHFVRLLLLAIVVFGPLAVVDDVVTVLLRDAAEGESLPLRLAALSLTIINISISLLGLTFYAGAIEMLVGASERGDPPPGLRHTAMALPWGLLIAVDVVSGLLTALGDLLLIVPGLIVFTLLAVTGPLAIIERRGVIATLRRSSALVRRRFWLVALLITVPTIVEEVLGDQLLHSDWLAGVTPTPIADIALAIFLGAAIGVTEAVLARALLEEEATRSPAHAARHPDRAAEGPAHPPQRAQV